MLTPVSASPQPLREFFEEAGFTHEQFKRNPVLRDLPSKHAGNLPALLERTSAATALNVVVRWFFLGLPLEGRFFDGLAPAPVVSLMLETGLLVREGDLWKPTVMLIPSEGMVFAADKSSRLESPEAADMILWPNPSTRLLQMFTIRRPSRATLDLGSGCGMLGLLTAEHSRQVVASDLNPRAAEFTVFNAWLNGVNNIECLTGDTFETVKDRTFDLILANPPFFVTPSSDQIYCENSMELDGYCRRVAREAACRLNEDGYLQMAVEWVQVRGQTWQERLAEWFEGSGCDAWVLRTYVRDGAGYAMERLERTMQWSAEGTSSRFEEWMEYYRARGVEEVHGGIVAMRKRSGANWLRLEETAGLDPTEPFGESILELFANQDVLAGHPNDEQTLTWRPRLAPDAQIEQQMRVTSGKWAPVSMKLMRTKGLQSSLALDPHVAEFLSWCNGSRSLEELSRELSARVKVDLAQVQKQCCGVVRKLAERRLMLL